ncbi:hypothetical protein ACIPJM_25340 [Streptomyces halstedii]|uniref:hypothetical protein n=1 Tax=Streptomyces halstedii TaxID=1944 RepID=UPI0038066D91
MRVTHGSAAVVARGARPAPTAFRDGTGAGPPTVSPNEGRDASASVTTGQLPLLAREKDPGQVVREADGHPVPAQGVPR